MACHVCFAAAAILLCAGAAAASSRFILDDIQGPAGRSLAQTRPNCTRVNEACTNCRTQRIPGSRQSELVCSTCATGWRLRRDGESKTCDCAPGLAFNASDWCATCPRGQYCPGGSVDNEDNAPSDCPAGLATTFLGAKSEQQCFTLPGYGRVSTRNTDGRVTLSGVLCRVGTYNTGGNSAGCQRCGNGLTTASTGSTNSSLCLAPAGSFMDRGSGKLCQKGTYTTALNSQAACTPCPTGITTSAEGSNTSTACNLAMQGYYLVSATVAAVCPRHTYADTEAARTSCTACPNGWRTQATAATGVAQCLAPPGFERVGNAAITECATGFYKEGWNRNPCVACGTNVITSDTGSVSRDACLVPAGFGITTLTPSTMAAAACELNNYGDDESRPATASARCVPCPTDMFTLDALTNTSRVGLYTSQAACLVAPGWGTTSTAPAICAVGTYNAGLNRSPCTPCQTGRTTVAEGKTVASQCVIQPGWRLGADGIPDPCDKGTYSLGGTEVSPNVTSCTSCPTGFSTQEDAADSADECSVCSAGYGGVGCAQCGYGTYSSGGAAVGEACTACAAGTTSGRRSTEVAACLPVLQDVRLDVFDLTNAVYTVASGVTTSTACAAACTGSADCILYRFHSTSSATPNRCETMAETVGGAQTLGFKIGAGADDYVVRAVPAGVAFGTVLASPTASTQAACLDACTANAACEVYSWTGPSTCRLARSDLSSDFTSMINVVGSKLYSDVTLV